MSGIETRESPGGGRMSVEQIEHELGALRMNEDGTLGLRASVLNLIVVTDEDSAADVTRSVSNIAGRYPSRAILLISDPEGESGIDVQVSAFCSVRGGGGADVQVCAEQVTIHAEGPPAEHLETLAGPLLVSDLPVFLWYPGPFSPGSLEFAGMAALADRIIIDSAAAGDCARSLPEIAALLDEEDPAVGDLQWVQLSPWRSLVSELFSSPERTGELEKLRRVEILYAPDGECRALLFTGWLASALDWRLESATRTENGREVSFAGPSGEISVEMSPASSDARFREVRIYSDDYGFEVARSNDLSEARTTVTRDGEMLAERTVHLGTFDLGVLLGEELRYRGRDEAYEAALRTAVQVLES